MMERYLYRLPAMKLWICTSAFQTWLDKKIEKIFADGEEIKVVHKKAISIRRKNLTENTTFTFEISMETVLLCAHPSVVFDFGKAAVMRGPIVYCAEETDNGTGLVSIILNANGKCPYVNIRKIFWWNCCHNSRELENFKRWMGRKAVSAIERKTGAM